MTRASFKSTWTKEEDECLLEAVAKWGPNDWYQIASAMPGRLPRQCRERYKNHARSGINTAPFTSDEDKIIVTAQAWCDVVLCVMFFAACVRTLTIGILSVCCALTIVRHVPAGGTSGWKFRSSFLGEQTTPSRTVGTPT